MIPFQACVMVELQKQKRLDFKKCISCLGSASSAQAKVVCLLSVGLVLTEPERIGKLIHSSISWRKPLSLDQTFWFWATLQSRVEKSQSLHQLAPTKGQQVPRGCTHIQDWIWSLPIPQLSLWGYTWLNWGPHGQRPLQQFWKRARDSSAILTGAVPHASQFSDPGGTSAASDQDELQHPLPDLGR